MTADLGETLMYTDYAGRTLERMRRWCPNFSEELLVGLVKLPRGTQLRALMLCRSRNVLTLDDLRVLLASGDAYCAPNIGRRTLADLADIVAEPREPW